MSSSKDLGKIITLICGTLKLTASTAIKLAELAERVDDMSADLDLDRDEYREEITHLKKRIDKDQHTGKQSEREFVLYDDRLETIEKLLENTPNGRNEIDRAHNRLNDLLNSLNKLEGRFLQMEIERSQSESAALLKMARMNWSQAMSQQLSFDWTSKRFLNSLITTEDTPLHAFGLHRDPPEGNEVLSTPASLREAHHLFPATRADFTKLKAVQLKALLKVYQQTLPESQSGRVRHLIPLRKAFAAFIGISVS